MSLTTTIKTIQDIMRKDVGLDGDAQRITQLVWMLFLKILDEQEKKIEKVNQNYISPVRDRYRWRNWPKVDEKKDPQSSERLLEFINGRLFPALKNDNSYQGESKLRQVIHSVFADAINYMKSGSLLGQVVNKIDEEIPFTSFEDQKHLGEVYEKILRDLQSAGNAGEFYTPRAVTEFIIDRLAPRVGEMILDPACGTGGFLAQAVDYLKKTNRRKTSKILQSVQDAPRGIEKKALPHMLAVTNMILHGINEPHRIEHKNTLQLYKGWDESKKVGIVVTNPPFGGEEEDGIEKDFPKEFKTRETADLFIHFIYEKMLKQGGRCAIVLPDGFLFGEGIKSRIKEDLTDKCNLHTIVRLPNGVFSPYTTIRTNILFFEKTGREKDSTQTIWFYEHPYPEGYSSYSKTRPMQFGEFKPEQEWWGHRYNVMTYEKREENEYAWKIDFKKEKDEALNKARPHYDEAKELEKQKQQRNKEINRLSIEIKKQRNQLKNSNPRIKTKQEAREKIKKNEDALVTLKDEVAKLERKAKDEQIAGDRLKYAAYNLDRKNPNTLREELLDPDKLLSDLKEFQLKIVDTQELLKSKLAEALLRGND